MFQRFERSLHDRIEITRIFRNVTGRAAATCRKSKVPAHRRRQNYHMKILPIEKAGQVGSRAEKWTSTDTGKNKKQWRRVIVLIEVDADIAATFESRQLISAGKPGHMDDGRLVLGFSSVVAQKRGRGGRQKGIVIRVVILSGLDGFRGETQ